MLQLRVVLMLFYMMNILFLSSECIIQCTEWKNNLLCFVWLSNRFFTEHRFGVNWMKHVNMSICFIFVSSSWQHRHRYLMYLLTHNKVILRSPLQKCTCLKSYMSKEKIYSKYYTVVTYLLIMYQVICINAVFVPIFIHYYLVSTYIL